MRSNRLIAQRGLDRTHMVYHFQAASLTAGHLDQGWFRDCPFFIVRSQSRRLHRARLVDACVHTRASDGSGLLGGAASDPQHPSTTAAHRATDASRVPRVKPARLRQCGARGHPGAPVAPPTICLKFCCHVSRRSSTLGDISISLAGLQWLRAAERVKF